MTYSEPVRNQKPNRLGTGNRTEPNRFLNYIPRNRTEPGTGNSPVPGNRNRTEPNRSHPVNYDFSQPLIDETILHLRVNARAHSRFSMKMNSSTARICWFCCTFFSWSWTVEQSPPESEAQKLPCSLRNTIQRMPVLLQSFLVVAPQQSGNLLLVFLQLAKTPLG